MFGLEMLDVVIGLVFFYLLLSLLASAIQEFIAGLLKLRSKTLIKSIEEMLKTEEQAPKSQNRSIAGTLNINEGKDQGQDLYSSFINNHSHYQKVQTANTQASTSGNTDSEEGKKPSPPAKKGSLATSFFGQAKMPSYLSSKSFADILTHVLHSDQDIKSIEDSINKLPSGKTKTSLQVMLKNAKGDVDAFKGHLAGWFDETMDRVSGQYKRKIQRILIAIGLILAVVFNADTLNIAGKLAEDPEARIELLQSAISYQQSAVQTPRTSSEPKTNQGDSSTDSLASPRIVPPRTSSQSTTTLDSLVNIHKTIKDLLSEEIESSNSTLGLGWENEGKKRKKFFREYYKRTTTQNTASRALDAEVKPTTMQKLRAWFSWWGPRISGWLLTAMAISLGAPFWFDMLNKLVNVRNSGQKPPTQLEREAQKTKPQA